MGETVEREEDGTVWLSRDDVWIAVREPVDGYWSVSFYPKERGRPKLDTNGFTTTSRDEDIPTDGGTDAVLAWARERWARVGQ